MAAIVRTFWACLLLVLATVSLSGCVTVNHETADRPGTDVEVGGRHGVVVEHGQPGSADVTVGGQHGIVVHKPGPGPTGTEVKIGGDKGIVVEHDPPDPEH